MHVSMGINTAMHGAISRTFTEYRRQKRTFAQKLGSATKGVHNVGVNIAGAAIPGGGVLSNAISGSLAGVGGVGSTLGGLVGEMDDGIAEMETQLRSEPDLARELNVGADLAQLRRQLQTLQTKLARKC